LGDALAATRVLGLRNNKPFLKAILDHPAFQAGVISTGFIDHHLKALLRERQSAVPQAIAAWLAARYGEKRSGGVWTDLGPWSLAGTPRKDFWDVVVDGVPLRVEVTGNRASYVTDGKVHSATVADHSGVVIATDPQSGVSYLEVEGHQFTIAPGDALARDVGAASGNAVTRAPMAGKVVRVLVEAGQEVAAGDTLIILEAMKMEHPLKAGIAGTVKTLAAVAGAQVADRDILCVLEALNP
jgi:acetyl/propionyl-CoA carboxylase alpha subunit